MGAIVTYFCTSVPFIFFFYIELIVKLKLLYLLGLVVEQFRVYNMCLIRSSAYPGHTHCNGMLRTNVQNHIVVKNIANQSHVSLCQQII